MKNREKLQLCVRRGGAGSGIGFANGILICPKIPLPPNGSAVGEVERLSCRGCGFDEKAGVAKSTSRGAFARRPPDSKRNKMRSRWFRDRQMRYLPHGVKRRSRTFGIPETLIKVDDGTRAV